MNLEEAKSLLLLYRPDTADADDPQIAEALAMAQQYPELAHWLKTQAELHASLRSKFNEISPPAGLREQIISEFRAGQRSSVPRRALGFAAAAMLVVIVFLAVVLPRKASDDVLANFQNRMVGFALSGYAMDIISDRESTIRDYLAKQQAPEAFPLPAPLQHATLTGCAVTEWQGLRVSLLCFRTARPSPRGANDLWLFVADANSVKDAPKSKIPEMAKVNRLFTATWTEGGRVYFLGIAGTEQDLKSYL